jgi:hypothetical protein
MTGLEIYEWRYKWEPDTGPKHAGSMADDVERLFPGSTELVKGYLYLKPVSPLMDYLKRK